MTTTTRKLTYHGTAAAATTDTITLTGADKTQPGAADPAFSATSSTGAAAINGGRIYNASATDLWYSFASSDASAPPDPATQTNEGVRRLPAGMTDSFNDVWRGVVFKVYSAAGGDYSIEVNNV